MGRVEVNRGDAVRVASGPFSGFSGLFVELLGDDKARVVLDVFGRSLSTELPLDELDHGAPGSGGAGVREPRRPLTPEGTAPSALPIEDAGDGSPPPT
jgi:hypothetical protein